MENLSYYERLGLPRDATQDEIRHAYRQLVLRLHPDTNVRQGETELFIGLQDAYEHLTDPIRKSRYDQDLSQSAEGNSPLELTILYSQADLAPMPEPQLLYCLLEFKLHPETSLLLQSTSLNISLVVDCSTSMQGARLDTVKLTAIDLLRQLQPSDIFSLVKFNDWPELLIPPGSLTDLKSTEMKVQLLQAGGGTEIFKGLEMAFNQVTQHRSNQRVNHIILITDGRTYGDEIYCERLADEAAALGIGISALGLGNQWNDKFLDRLTSKTGGICRYLAEVGEIRSSLLEELGRLGTSLTEQISLSYHCPAGISIRSGYRLEPDAAPLVSGSPMILGHTSRHGKMKVMLELVIDEIQPAATSIRLANAFVNYEIPRHTQQTRYVQRLALERQVALAPSTQPPPPAIIQAMAAISLNQIGERAREAMNDGNISSATHQMETLATQMLKGGETDLARTVLDEVAYMRQNRSFSEDGEKRIKYGTRALMLPPKTEESFS